MFHIQRFKRLLSLLAGFAVTMILPGAGDAFTITTPEDGVVVVPGQEIAVSVDIPAKSGISQIKYYWYRESEEPRGSHHAEAAHVGTASSMPPYGGRIPVPREAIGLMRLLAVAEVSGGRLAGTEDFDERLIRVEPEGELLSIEFESSKPWRLDTIGRILLLPVIGQFADGTARPLMGRASGSQFDSTDEQVVMVSPEGSVRVTGHGRATITVTNRGKVGKLEVVVTGEQGPNRPPVAKVDKELVVKAGTPVVLNGLQSSDPDGDPLRYEWKQTRGNSVTLMNLYEPKATFTAPKVAKRRLLQFQLRVTDMMGPDTVKGADSQPATIDVWVDP